MKKVVSVIVLSMFLVVTLFGGTNIKNVSAAATVKSIKITSYPDKRAYNIGDAYSTKGLVVVATMSDGKTETVDNSKITSFSGVELTEGRQFVQEGWKSVELRYQGATATFGIAVFDPAKEYYITYDSDGGSTVAKKKIDASTKKFNLPTPTKKGYTFMGWYHSNGNKYTKYEPGMGPSLAFKAKWGRTITFNANGGTGKMKNGVTDSEYQLPKSGFKKSGYKFVGWSTKKKATGYDNFYEVGSSGANLDNGKGSVTLYAQWVKPKSYKITYASVKGVTISKAIKKYTSGKTTMLPIASIKADKIFVGWKLTVNGKKVGIFMEIPPFVTGDIKLTPEFGRFEG